MHKGDRYMREHE